MKVKSESEVAQSYPTLSDPMDCSPPGSSEHGIFLARVLEWGAIAFPIGEILHLATLLKMTWQQARLCLDTLYLKEKTYILIFKHLKRIISNC